MKSVEQTQFEQTFELGAIDKLARRLLFKRLENMPKGRLVIEESGSSFEFGCADSKLPISAVIQIKGAGAYRDIVFGGSIGGAEAYIEGKWTSPNLVDVVRLMAVNIDFLNELDGGRFFITNWLEKGMHWLNRNTQSNSKKNISRHYDLSNQFFELFLDAEMMYSSAVFEREDTPLEEAAVAKLELVCQKLDLKPEDHLLEIGTGWGGLAIHAARNYGCKVTTTTISGEQYKAACSRVSELGLESQITVLFQDYRLLEGKFDKLVSIEMIEAVGLEYYPQYFSSCSSLLQPGGLMLLQAITVPEQRYDYARKSVDFIQRHIFPGGSLPCHQAIMTAIKKHTDMQLVHMQEIGRDYAKTLEHWRHRFTSRLDDVRLLGFDEYFIRKWHYYLCYCEGAFEERAIGTAQIVFAKPEWKGDHI